MGIKIGSLNIDSLKVGSGDCTVYLGDTLLYSGGTPPAPSFSGKYLANYSNGTSYSADCDSDTTITEAQTKPSGYDFTKMTDCVIGSCITTIGGLAFQAGHLSSVTIMEGVTIIGQEAFEYCAQLTTDIVLPSTITAIGKWAFRSVSPSSITCLATTPPTLGSSVFDNSSNFPIYVPSESLNAYKSAWSSYSSRIQAIQ